MGKIAGILCFLGALAVAGYAFYLHRSIEAVSKLPGANLQVVPWTPTSVQGKSRFLNLGYATMQLPDEISANPERIGQSLYVSVGSEKASVWTSFCAPLSDKSDEVQEFLQSAAELGASAATSFELKKTALGSRPFTFGDAVVMGREAAARQATLLMLKSLLFPADSSGVRVFENQRLGIFIFEREGLGLLDIYEKRSRVAQTILVKGPPDALLRVANYIVTSYEIVGAPTQEADFAAKLTEAGIAETEETAAPAPSMSETQRLGLVANEIRQRRAVRN